MTDVDPSLQQPAARNGFVWEVGNGLAKTTVVTYLARELGANATLIGFLIAAPYFAGLARLAMPAVLKRFPQRRGPTLALLCASSAVLMAVPVVSMPGLLPTNELGLTALSLSWGLWHLLLYLGVVSLFTWFGEIVPAGVRGEFLGRRERWKMAGAIAGAVLSGLFAELWIRTHAPQEKWWAYALPIFYGGAVMMFSNVYLVDLPESSASAKPGPPAAKTPFSTDFLLFLAFACWRAFAASLTQAAIGIFNISFLKLPVLTVLLLESGMRVGQSWAAPWVGKWMDRHGNRTMLIASQVITGLSLALLFPATQTHWHWMIGVYATWICFVGLNVGLYRTMLDLAPRASPARHVAWYYALTDVAAGIGAVGGGMLFDWLPRDSSWRWHGLNRFQLFFAIGILLRLSAVIPLWRWREKCGTLLRNVKN